MWSGDRPSYGRLMAQLGADDVQVDKLAATFDRTATGLTKTEETISALVRSVAWCGPDADVFRGKWIGGMRLEMSTVSDRLKVVASDLRKQATAQRTASESLDISVSPEPPMSEQEEIHQLKLMAAEARVRAVEADAWAEEAGRLQIRDESTKSDEDQLEWWNHLTGDQRAALLRNDPGALFGLDGLPVQVRADARTAYIESVRGDIEISSQEDKLEGELDIAWVHLGAEGSAKIVQLADGTYRVDLALKGEIGAKVGEGAKGEVGVGAGVSQSYEFTSQKEAEDFVHGLYDQLTPDVGWNIFEGPSAVMADTVEDVVHYLQDHSDQRTSFEGELELQGKLDLELGAWDVNISGEAGGKYDFDTHETTAFVKGSVEGELELPSTGDGTTGSYKLNADLEVDLKFDEHRNVSELEVKGTVGGSANVGLEAFLNGTTPQSADPHSIKLTAEGGAQVTFDAKLDLQDPIVQQRAAALLNAMGTTGGVSLPELQHLLEESSLQVQVDAMSVDSDKWDIGIASLEVSHTDTQNVVTWVKPPGGDFTWVSPAELTGGGSQ
jgi:hypothetical protein